MFFLLGSDKGEKNTTKKSTGKISSIEKVKELFKTGRFPVVTTQEISDRKIAKVLGLVCCRGFDADEAFFGMAAMAQNKGGQAIIGYCENVAFHPDGSKFFSCFGTAVMFERDSRDVRDLYQGQFNSKNSYEDDTQELLNLAVENNRPSEEEDPVLQKLLLQKKQQQSKITLQ